VFVCLDGFLRGVCRVPRLREREKKRAIYTHLACQRNLGAANGQEMQRSGTEWSFWFRHCIYLARAEKETCSPFYCLFFLIFSIFSDSFYAIWEKKERKNIMLKNNPSRDVAAYWLLAAKIELSNYYAFI
jgi:hypothetical protein